jgi:hypothetical protein
MDRETAQKSERQCGGGLPRARYRFAPPRDSHSLGDDLATRVPGRLDVLAERGPVLGDGLVEDGGLRPTEGVAVKASRGRGPERGRSAPWPGVQDKRRARALRDR